MNISLTGPEWTFSNNVWVKGFIRIKDKYLSGNDLLSYFRDVVSESVFEKKLTDANGLFSVVVHSGNETWAAVDHLRNYPLYYSFINSEYHLTDDCNYLAEKITGLELDPIAVQCFLSSGFTLNNTTIFRNLYQIEAGELVVFKNSVVRRFYCSYELNDVSHNGLNESVNNLTELLHQVFSNHFKSLSGRFFVIPLSGGYDSRLVAAMCSLYHKSNVLCITYGSENNREVKPAQEVSKRLGLQWLNIIYDSKLTGDFINDGYFSKYYEEVSGFTSMFYMQDYFAVRYLKDNNLIPDDAVFMPGFSGDSLAGSFFRKSFMKDNTTEKIAGHIFRNKFALIPVKGTLRKEIIKLITEKINQNAQYLWKNYENWEIKEIHAKLIVNSAKAFSFFGYDYVFPLFDKELTDYFTSLPFEFKLNKKLYDKTLTENIFRDLGINLASELNPSMRSKTYQDFKERTKRYLPLTLINKFIELKSPLFYDEITKQLKQNIPEGQLINPSQANYYNAYLTQWYLWRIKEKFNLVND